MKISVVLPVLDAGAELAATLATLDTDCEILVVDGGSKTPPQPRPGMRVLSAPRGRGMQLAAGAEAAHGDWLLFLHADTTLLADWRAAVAAFAADPANAEKAGYFRLAFATTDPRGARVAALANWRARVFGLPYGDQGLLMARSFYTKIGGYRSIPLMEDVDFVRRIGRKNLVALAATAVTSARRYERDGWWLRPLRNLFCLALYFAGVSPQAIARLYR
ncbi:MAG: TIGR04283 family arsenosugar biosynthesis glycosyltransferase [Telmatospirillum sp.]|nr:TIGR04283 family arsenosugar biosynthesis glycosyltransferase [Telmatospirillum sp.]